MKSGLLFFLFAMLFLGCQPKMKQTATDLTKTGVQREAFDAKKYPGLAAVGRIRILGRKKHCTLVLVAEDLAVTAGHCFLEEVRLSDTTKDLDENLTSVFLRSARKKRLEITSVKRVLRAKMDPDFAIVSLSRKISSESIKPLKVENLTPEEIRSRIKNLGCAGFNGDKKLGDGGFTMTISRNIDVVGDVSSQERIDTNCVSTHGGSGGAFFEERRNNQTNQNEIRLIGVIWGVTDDSFDEKGNQIRQGKSVTSITPVQRVFYDELQDILRRRNGEGRAKN